MGITTSSSTTTTASAKIARELQIAKNKKAYQSNNRISRVFGFFRRQQQLLFLYINVTLFAGMPMDLPFHKKFDILMNNSKAGMWWELITAVAALFASSCYVAETYSNRNYKAIQFFKNEDAVVSIMFTIDYVITLLVTQKRLKFFFSPTGIIDLATFIPYWITLGILITSGGTASVNLGMLRFLRLLRILRLMRFLRLLKTLKEMGGALTIQKQIATIVFTVFAVIFIGAGIFQIMENDVKAIMEYSCQSIGSLTDFRPSCCDDLPFADCNVLSYCDCLDRNCKYQYNYNDPEFQPSAISCETVSYFNSIYFLVVTVATLGYGDFAPSTELSRLCVMFIILFSIVVIPLQVQNLAKIVGMTSTFRQRYVRQKGKLGVPYK